MKTFFFALSLAALAHQVAATTGQPSSITGSNTTTTSPTSKPKPANWTALGCYSQEHPAQPILEQKTTGNDAFMSLGLCTSRCSAGNFPFAGMQNGNLCWCGSRLGGALAKNQGDCNVPCSGYPTDTCGGLKALSVFKADGIDGAPSVSSTATTATPAVGTLSGTASVLTTAVTAGAMRNLAMFGW